ncbi:hypothetical protein H4J63_06305 [Pseudoalteromonas sp. 5Ae-yellow]|uniref:hypothetical protein n=1 Tax=Pseudoalteromonas sp. 5Ae-yellow TaxID=2759847 RepID=UPI0015F70BEF|nr:hypothetical protein [Pseudoalteromonas sp. 5Ae-yellow]MBA6408958.1 hypothetical protein [Pseudoalteromonas sp. 5Ae-yellow]
MDKNKCLKSLQSTEYKLWLTELKHKVASSQQKAVVKVNAELLTLCGQLGNNLLPNWFKSLGGTTFKLPSVEVLAQLGDDHE